VQTPREVSSVGHHPAAMTSTEASMTSRRPQPSNGLVSLAGGAPRGAPSRNHSSGWVQRPACCAGSAIQQLDRDRQGTPSREA
jgi:hypothetical protein